MPDTRSPAHDDLNEPSADSVVILAGAGTLPFEIATSVTERGGRVHIVGLRGVADPAIEAFPHGWTGLGQVGRMLRLMREPAFRKLVIVGGLVRPNLWTLAPDLGFVRHLNRIATIMRGGDDAVLRRVIGFFEDEGFEVIGASDIAPELLARASLGSSTETPDAETAKAMSVGSEALSRLSDFDIGQAVVAGDNGVIGIEDGGGTARLLQSLRIAAGRKAVLVKLPKRGQELRIDMPTIGPQTINDALQSGVTDIAVDADATLIAERAKTFAAATAAGVRVHSIATAQTQDLPTDNNGPHDGLDYFVPESDATANDPDAAKAMRFVSTAWPMTDAHSVGVFVRRGHPMVCLVDGHAGTLWTERLSRLSPLRGFGIFPQRWGALAILADRTAMGDLCGEPLARLRTTADQIHARSLLILAAADIPDDMLQSQQALAAKLSTAGLRVIVIRAVSQEDAVP